ncbi:EAL domain-containing protein [Bacillus sp. S/N-304-OC-R1]|uniref:bifunctional diguanylate cyclase/phosphodiesterase n=1 Tax=Bacillus sp. S/N-304-OC-R1 TaxID=2758034 RepID=UPI001C8E6E9B|nr:EAL domain-containing protein [Bacillus sp. S/N-304-OC-R1]MBY0123338.1 EAL domain-containing protein [Bacillus sp. S/N-304-OC-R1]
MVKEQTRYSRLAYITKLINTKLDLREVLQHVTTAISEEIVQCDSVGIYLPQEDGSFRGYVGKPEIINGMTLDMHVIDTDIDLLAKEVIETQKTIYIHDTSKDSRPDPRAVEAFKIKSLLALPISYENELFGLVFLFDYGIPMNLTEEEIQTVEAYVNMAAVAIQNAANLTRKENLIKEKQLLLDLTRELSLCSTMQEGMDKCFFYVGKVLNNPNVGVHILDPIAGKKIKPVSLSKDSDWPEEDWVRTHNKFHMNQTNDAVFKEVIETKKALLIPDVFADHRPNHEVCRYFGIKGMFMLPLVSMGEVLGVIAVVNLEECMNYSNAEILLAQSIVDATASTLSNLLYMEKQELIIEERTSEIRIKNQELERVVAELKQLSRENELILNSAGEGIFGLDLDGNITFCNQAGKEMLGYDSGELIGDSYKTIFKRHKGEMQKSILPYTGTDQQFFRKDGTSFPVEYVISPITEGDTKLGEVVTFKDITQRKQLEEEITHLAFYDSLTNLPNRVLLNDRLQQALAYGKRNNEKVAVLYLDLDRFKLINDSLGHSFGDLLLREAADRLSSSIPDHAIISRQGGDEFTIILPIIHSNEDVLKVVNQVIQAFSNPFHLKENELYVKTSIGISLFPENGDSVETLIKNADAAMYKAKEISGNSYYFFKSGMDNRTLASMKLENALYKALDQDELVIYYQPQMNCRTNEVFGAEALIRWNHPAEGMISPADFIPIAEETGLIVPIGEWVLRNACKQLKEWHNQGHTFMSVSVNLSVRQFEENNLFMIVKEILEEVDLPAGCLHLELTENQIIKNTEITLSTMGQLKDLGVHIAIDDFGTGYSSLGYLRNFPISTLKVDKTFVQDIINDEDNAAITDTIITLAQNLKLDVIAEGVETKEQVEFLSSKNCYLMQGYYFSKPLKAEDFAEQYLPQHTKLTFGGIS